MRIIYMAQRGVFVSPNYSKVTSMGEPQDIEYRAAQLEIVPGQTTQRMLLRRLVVARIIRHLYRIRMYLPDLRKARRKDTPPFERLWRYRSVMVEMGRAIIHVYATNGCAPRLNEAGGDFYFSHVMDVGGCAINSPNRFSLFGRSCVFGALT